MLATADAFRFVMTPARNAPHLLHVFSTFEVGGAQMRFATIANHFGPALKHTIVAMDGKYGFAERLAADVPVHLRQVPVRQTRLLGNRSVFRQVLREIAPDILLTHNWGTIEWAMANWPRIVSHIHIEDGFGPEEAYAQITRRVLARRLILRGSIVVVPSRNLERIARQSWKLAASRIRYIPNGIACERFAAGAGHKAPPPWPGEGPVIGTVAALRAEKNLHRLVRAFAKIAAHMPCRLVIVGEGAERPRLEALAARVGCKDRVIFTGHIPDPAPLYGAFDMFALTSDTEQMPYTVIEAMAAGLPIAATQVGDVPIMVAAENTPYIVARDDDAVAAALQALLADRGLRARIGKANQLKAQSEYDQSAMFAAFAKLYGSAP
jgi:glycosyltransferase involved in cell wall biosynthesis